MHKICIQAWNFTHQNNSNRLDYNPTRTIIILVPAIMVRHAGVRGCFGVYQDCVIKERHGQKVTIDFLNDKDLSLHSTTDVVKDGIGSLEFPFFVCWRYLLMMPVTKLFNIIRTILLSTCYCFNVHPSICTLFKVCIEIDWVFKCNSCYLQCLLPSGGVTNSRKGVNSSLCFSALPETPSNSCYSVFSEILNNAIYIYIFCMLIFVSREYMERRRVAVIYAIILPCDMIITADTISQMLKTVL